MRKLLFALVAVLMATLNMNAQNAGDVNMRIRGGLTYASLSGADGADYKFGWSVGAGIDYDISDKFAIGVDASYDRLGCELDIVDQNLNLDYLSVGPIAKLYVSDIIALQAGVQVNFLMNAKQKDWDVKDALKSNTISLPLGVVYEQPVGSGSGSIVVDLRYHWGLTRVEKEFEWGGYDGDGDKLYNSALILTVGYKFSL